MMKNKQYVIGMLMVAAARPGRPGYFTERRIVSFYKRIGCHLDTRWFEGVEIEPEEATFLKLKYKGITFDEYDEHIHLVFHLDYKSITEILTELRGSDSDEK